MHATNRRSPDRFCSGRRDAWSLGAPRRCRQGWPCEPGSCCWRPRATPTPRSLAWSAAPPGRGALAWPLWPGRAGRPAPLRPTPHHQRCSPGRDRRRHPGRPARRPRHHALVRGLAPLASSVRVSIASSLCRPTFPRSRWTVRGEVRRSQRWITSRWSPSHARLMLATWSGPPVRPVFNRHSGSTDPARPGRSGWRTAHGCSAQAGCQGSGTPRRPSQGPLLAAWLRPRCR